MNSEEYLKKLSGQTSSVEENNLQQTPEEESSFIRPEQVRTLPDSFKVDRTAQLQLAKIERDLFSDIEEKQSRNYIISGLTKSVTELDFTAFSFALGQILYNQSVLYGNEENNTGIERKRAIIKDGEKIVFEGYEGTITTTLNEICRFAYGVDEPDRRQKKTMATLIEAIDREKVFIKYPNGDTKEGRLIAVWQKYNRKEDNSITYNIGVNPIFCANIQRNFGELPQDIVKRLSGVTRKKSVIDYRLIRVLSIQRKGEVFTRGIEELVSLLGIERNYYDKQDKSRAEKQLLSACEHTKQIGLVERYEVSYHNARGKQYISKITFHLSDRVKMLNRADITEGEIVSDSTQDKPQKRGRKNKD